MNSGAEQTVLAGDLVAADGANGAIRNELSIPRAWLLHDHHGYLWEIGWNPHASVPDWAPLAAANGCTQGILSFAGRDVEKVREHGAARAWNPARSEHVGR